MRFISFIWIFTDDSGDFIWSRLLAGVSPTVEVRTNWYAASQVQLWAGGYANQVSSIISALFIQYISFTCVGYSNIYSVKTTLLVSLSRIPCFCFIWEHSILLYFSFEALNNMEFRPVKVRGEFLHDKEILIGPRALIEENQSLPRSGSLMSDPKKNQGWLVITPFKISDSG